MFDFRRVFTVFFSGGRVAHYRYTGTSCDGIVAGMQAFRINNYDITWMTPDGGRVGFNPAYVVRWADHPFDPDRYSERNLTDIILPSTERAEEKENETR